MITILNEKRQTILVFKYKHYLFHHVQSGGRCKIVSPHNGNINIRQVPIGKCFYKTRLYTDIIIIHIIVFLIIMPGVPGAHINIHYP